MGSCCNYLCCCCCDDSTPHPQTHFPLPSQPRDLHKSVTCQICQEHVQAMNYKLHLDVCHFAQVVQQSNGHLDIYCLLCNFKSESFKQHKSHLQTAHHFAEEHGKKMYALENKNHLQYSNQSIKGRVEQLAKLDIVVHNNGRTGQVNGRFFEVRNYSQQYGPAEFNQNIAKGDVVWRPIFTELRDALYYCVQYIQLQRTIQARSTIFFNRNQY